ncbi:beta-lactamase family protein [Lactobacillus sp. DCY120]|uniref:Beta-lactamase family protein n=1 Tax=Bombilactobacillus apium TaxID=2675299 RepID=A0A850QZW3_9LACO|nr:serine hydrolase domain-containing protein [Bombilactobacillus apium]NVY95630.1 beta-lactamase family protein [Bombilactobacillus apium]
MRIVSQLQALVNDQVVPGLSYAYLTEKNCFQGQWGVNTWQPQVTTIPPDALYDLASLTKVLGTTTAVLQLIGQGIWTYDLPVQKLIPEFPHSQVTLRQLMTHTSGLRGYIPQRDQLTSLQLLQAIINLPLTSEWRRVIRYTDTGPILAGVMLERYYQWPVQVVIEKQVLRPLALKTATFQPNPQQCVVTSQRNNHWLRGVVHDPKAFQLGKHCASAGLFAGIADLLKFSSWFLGLWQPATAPISQAQIQTLFQSFTRVSPGRSFGWDLLWNAQQEAVLYHTGYTGNFWILDRAQKRALIVLSNRVHPENNNQRFLRRRNAIVENFLNN